MVGEAERGGGGERRLGAGSRKGKCGGGGGGLGLRRLLPTPNWRILPPADVASSAETAARALRRVERKGQLSYRRADSGGGRRWCRVLGRLSRGRLQLESLTDGSVLLSSPLIFPLISVEESQRRLQLVFHADQRHHLWVPGQRRELDGWVEALREARDEAQRIYLQPPHLPADHGRLPADLRSALLAFTHCITQLKRSLVLLRTLPPPKATWFKSTSGILSSSQVHQLQMLQEKLAELSLAWEAVSGAAAMAPPSSQICLKVTQSKDHLILQFKQGQQEQPLAKESGLGLEELEEPLFTAMELREESSRSTSTSASSASSTDGPSPAKSYLPSSTAQSRQSAASKSPGRATADPRPVALSDTGKAERSEVVLARTALAKRAYRKTLPATMPESRPITLSRPPRHLHGVFRLSVVMKALADSSLPLEFFEPLGMLQRVSEQLEYSALLDEAAGEGSAVRRLALVVAYAVGSLSGSLRRTGKPFNPLLGETYTLDRWEERGWRYVAEQVVHSPDVSAAAAEGRGWDLHGVFQAARPRFAFTHVAMAPKCSWDIHLKTQKETFRFESVQVRVMKPLSATQRKVHHHGTLSVVCSSGLRAEVELEAGKTEVRGRVFRSERPSEGLGTLTGDWASQLSLATPAQPKPATLFRANALPADAPSFFGFGHLARELNEVGPWERDAEGRPGICPTDSRYRPDQRAFEEGRLEEAQRLKEALEAAQRARRNAAPGPHVPLFFRRHPAAPDPANLFLPKHSFWPAHQRSFHGLSFPPHLPPPLSPDPLYPLLSTIFPPFNHILSSVQTQRNQ